MTQYHITALGNALVDKEFSVSPEFLAEQHIEKGFMTLFEGPAHQSLQTNLYEHYTLRAKASGGCAANTLVTAAQFGASTFYCCRVGNDELGKFYQSDLAEAGVQHDLESRSNEGTTGTCIVMVTPDADRTMCTYLGITTDFSIADINEDAIKQSQYLYIEGHLMYQDAAVEAILRAKQIARQNNVKVAVTFSDPSVVNYAKANLAKVLGEDGADIIFCNQDEVTAWAEDFDSGLASLKTLTPLLVVTKGAKGATIYLDESEIMIPGFDVEAIDTTGAGDTFAGAFMYGITSELSLEQCGLLASKCGAACVASFGPRVSKQTQQMILDEIVTN